MNAEIPGASIKPKVLHPRVKEQQGAEMRITEIIRPSVLLAALIVAAAAWGQTSSMPLGDVVKLSKPAGRATHVYTNADFPSRPAEETASGSAVPPDEQDQAKPKSAAAASHKNQVLAQQMSDLKDAETTQKELIRKIKQKLDDDTELLSPQQRQSYMDALKQSETVLDSYRQQRAMLQQIAAKNESEAEDKAETKGQDKAEDKAEGKTPEARPQAGQAAETNRAASAEAAQQGMPKSAE